MIELAPGLYRVPTSVGDTVNSYLFVEASGQLTLVDAGMKSAPRKLLRAIAALGKQPEDVTRIVMTHAHPDHAGGLDRMKRETGGRVSVHPDDRPYLEAGETPPRDRRSLSARIMGMLPGGDFDGVEVDETFSDGDLLDVGGGLRVVHTPGHSPGHVALMHEPSGVLITGDTLFNTPWMLLSPKLFTHDIPLSRETVWRLGDFDYEVAAFTHGREIRDEPRRRITEFLHRKLKGREG